MVILRNSDNTNNAFIVNSTGNVNNNVTNSYAVRPVFNLEMSVNFVSGSGTMQNPIRIS